MDIGKLIRSKWLLMAVALIIIIVSLTVLLNIVAKSEYQGSTTAATIRYPESSMNKNATYDVWTKVVKTSSGVFPIETEGYNVLAVSLYDHGYWNGNGWNVPIQVVGFGATRSTIGFLRMTGLKSITLSSGQPQGIHSFTRTDINGLEEYYGDMLSTATRSLDRNPWPEYSRDKIKQSMYKKVSVSSDYHFDSDKNTYTSNWEKWQYSDLFGGSDNDAIFAVYTYSTFSPGNMEEFSYTSTFTWGLLDASRNQITLRMHLPPNPETLTRDQLDHYGIFTYTYQDNGQTRTGYGLDNVDCEA